ncbi:hypothetical protein FRC05_008927 [Tulasnella sp. 425]|nr:hypothetical protein FRC05_008927 [Tulasnella sp. 425]
MNYASYESASDDEPMIKQEEGAATSNSVVAKKGPSKSKPRGSVSSENNSRAGSSKPKPKPLAKKKSTQNGTLNAFFKKA